MSGLTRVKWRPSLAQVVASVIILLLSLPLTGLLLLNFYSKQLVQQTEESLIAQSAILAAQFSEVFLDAKADPRLGRMIAPAHRPDPTEPYTPILPSLSPATADIQPPRADGQLAIRRVLPVYARIGATLTGIAERAQIRTLAAYQILDPYGRVIGGTGEVGYALGHVPEVAAALSGKPTTVLRQRISDEPTPPLWSISRRANVRVFVAMPATIGDHVIGAVYVSRTPGNVPEYAYRERRVLLQAGGFAIFFALLIGFVFWRFITRPLYGLIETTRRIAAEGRNSIKPLDHYGTRELARLGDSFLRMADRLHRRSENIQTFTRHVTHELKSPITAIIGATELLQEQGAEMSDPQRDRFLANIAGDARRMTRLLEDLRSLAAAKEVRGTGPADLPASLNELRLRFDGLRIIGPDVAMPVPMAQDNLTIILTHLAENAAEHGATLLEVAQADGGNTLTVRDDGPGIPQENHARIFDPFFTTRAEDGGTGMGLGIVSEIIAAAQGRISLVPTKTGALFSISFNADLGPR